MSGLILTVRDKVELSSTAVKYIVLKQTGYRQIFKNTNSFRISINRTININLTESRTVTTYNNIRHITN